MTETAAWVVEQLVAAGFIVCCDHTTSDADFIYDASSDFTAVTDTAQRYQELLDATGPSLCVH